MSGPFDDDETPTPTWEEPTKTPDPKRIERRRLDQREMCAYAEDHPKFEIRLTTIEREMSEVRRHREREDRDWSNFLVAFGELKSDVAGLKGRVAGYLLAGMVLAAVVAVIGQRVVR